MFCKWNEILQSHFVPIPAIPDGGYTSYYFFEFKNGIVSMRKTAESEIEHTHAYVQRQNGKDENTPYEVLMNRCNESLEKLLFTEGKTFHNATENDINVGSRAGLLRHPGNSLTEAKITSFWTKGFSIPSSYVDYYPVCPTELKENQGSEIVIEKKRKEMDDATRKLVKKLKQPVVLASTIYSKSIASYFAPFEYKRYRLNDAFYINEDFANNNE